MKDRFLDQAKHAYSPKQRSWALMALAPVFLLLLPWALIALGTKLDQWLYWPPLLFWPVNLVVGLLLVGLGLLFGLWSNYVQFTIGEGTPVPLMATQKLIVQPPYTYCRNPMALGAIAAYLGVAVLFGSLGAGLLVLLGAISLLAYIKVIEEKEMELRFGQEYLEYKRQTSFLVPRFWMRK